MSEKVARLLARLDEIGHSLEGREGTLVLLGLGSVGEELCRLDEYSDLDFFVIVEPEEKIGLLADLGWLADVRPIVYAFRNTLDGWKVLFDDDIFCEFALFEPDELAVAAYTPGRIVWKRAHVADSIARPARAPTLREPDATHALGEALTNLYVGLGRYLRGERLSAQRFIQHFAVDHVVTLSCLVEPEQGTERDPFAAERRFEQRFPATARLLPRFVQGYEWSPESALAILDFLEGHFEVNAALAQRIRGLAARARDVT